MSTKQITPIRKAWYQWKALRLPWRKRFLVGLDLQGNTYWEFRLARGDDALAPNATPFRRIVHYPRSVHYSEIKVPPAWHQWLRYQREKPPTIQEQSAEKMRQERIKLLAAEADARWEAKPSLLDMPTRGGEKKVDQATSQENRQEQWKDKVEKKQEQGGENAQAKQASPQTKAADDPWKRLNRGGPSETWQPEAWTPTPTKKQ
ncbi:hypothetical protein HD806DRAFT_2271 [Xylariaceae sp. AK1471]|nr:hypothetical protein HD806DRAFT_2271 [Xylariaceae sp. AK1471]